MVAVKFSASLPASIFAEWETGVALSSLIYRSVPFTETRGQNTGTGYQIQVPGIRYLRFTLGKVSLNSMINDEPRVIWIVGVSD